MISSSLRSPALLVLALAVSAGVAGCGSSSATAPSAAAPASSTAAPGTPSSAGTPAAGDPSSAPPAGVTPTVPAAASTRPAAPVSSGDCPSLALVRATLGVAVGAPTANGAAQGVVVCSYPKGTNPSAVLVRIQEDQTAAGFAAARAGFAKSGQRTVDVPDMFDGAYRSQLGSAAAGVTRTLVVLRGSTEVLVTAQTSFDGLTKLTHTMLD